MKNRRKKQGLFRRILNRYKKIPRQLRSPKVSVRSKAQKLITLTICMPVLLYCAGYMGWYKYNQTRIEKENARYQAMYATSVPTAAPVPAATATLVPTPEPTAVPTAEPTAVPTAPATALITPVPTPTATAVPTSVPTPSPTATLEPMPEFLIAADATLYPYATPNANTLVIALETPGPIQEAFRGLLEMNPETVGYLTVGQDISLPVVQKRFDNKFYLDHNFEGEESNAGTLFMDGSNLLAPEDLCLIVYGHNMKNGTMFHKLLEYENHEHLEKYPLIYFDTIYKNRAYVPFAMFSASMDEGSKNYIDIRQFAFDEDSFDAFVQRMRRLSVWDVPVDVQYGDSVLLLVTCEYTYDNGRFVLALRAVNEDETEDQMIELVRQAKTK